MLNLRCAAACLALSLLPFYSVALAQEGRSDLLLILDASGSMWGQVDGKNKIVIAREVLADLAEKLPAETEAGLIAYGHRREGDCSDIETLAPLGTLDKATLIARVNAVNPKGKTPITASIEQAVAAVRSREGPATIVLLSDGIETCGGDPCAAVAEAKRAGAEFLLHVIGFDMAKEDVADLECAAQAGGGLYFDASNAQELTAALEQAVADEPEAPLADGALSIKAIRNGVLTDAAIQIADSSGTRIAAGRTYAREATNPRRIPVPAGTYQVVVSDLGLKGDSERRFEVEIARGETVERTLDFSSGKLAIRVTRNGELSDATVNAYRDGGPRATAAGRTYRAATSNPRVLEVTPGTYDVEIGSVEVANHPTRRWEGVEVEPGGLVELEHEFSSGVVRIGSTLGGELVDAVVNVQHRGETRSVAGGRTYTGPKTNPRAFVLTPGAYTITVKPLRVEGNPQQTIEVDLEPGATIEHVLEF